MNTEWDTAVIGGGASGLTAACIAAAAGCRVILLERGERVGRKLLVTGNGKCNLTNRSEGGTDCYFSETPECVRQLRRRCTTEQTLHFFRSIGLLTRTDSAGRVYPYSEQASAVLDVLRAACRMHGVEERCAFEVVQIKPVNGGFRLFSSDGTCIAARTVITACGGPAAPANGGTDSGIRLLCGLGHTAVAPRPALVPIRTDNRLTRPLKGLRVKCAVTLLHGTKPLRRETGELQFGDGQLSGVCIFQLSRQVPAAPKNGEWTVSIDLLPDWDGEPLDLLADRAARFADYPAETSFLGLFHKKIGYELLRIAVPDVAHRTVGDITAAELRRLAQLCRAWPFPVRGTGGFSVAQVTAGGIRLTEFTADLESRRVPGLFACGEILDADGICGGYNLQWAWSTGLLAGRGAAKACGKTGWNENDFSI